MSLTYNGQAIIYSKYTFICKKYVHIQFYAIFAKFDKARDKLHINPWLSTCCDKFSTE